MRKHRSWVSVLRTCLACITLCALAPAGAAFSGDEPPPADTSARSGRMPAALKDPDPRVRLRAVARLALDGGPAAMDALAGVALFDALWSVRREAVHTLGEVGTDANIPALEQALLDPDVRVRAAAIDAVTEVGGDQAARALVFALVDRDPSLREDAVYALGDIGGPIAVGILQQALEDEERSVRETTEEVLAELAGQD